jgi:hypothetical protein
MLNDPVYGQISLNCSLSNTMKLKLGHNVQLFSTEIKAPPGQDIVEYEI